jgi:hypothetical protein
MECMRAIRVGRPRDGIRLFKGGETNDALIGNQSSLVILLRSRAPRKGECNHELIDVSLVFVIRRAVRYDSQIAVIIVSITGSLTTKFDIVLDRTEIALRKSLRTSGINERGLGDIGFVWVTNENWLTWTVSIGIGNIELTLL